MGRWMVYVAAEPTAIDPRPRWTLDYIRPHGCALVEPARCLIEEYLVVVRHTLVDASSGSGSVLIVNPNAEVVVLPGLMLIGKLVSVAASSRIWALLITDRPHCRSTWRRSSRALTRRWVKQADNFCEICCFVTDMFSRRRGTSYWPDHDSST